MPKKVQPIPEGFHTVTPYLVVKDATKAIEFYKKAFGVEVKVSMEDPRTGKIGHAELKIGDSIVMVGEESEECGYSATKTSLCLYVENVDKSFERAVKAGAKVKFAVEDKPWGDRFGQVSDAWGTDWALATHKEDLTQDEIGKRMEKMMAEGAAN